MIRFLFKSLCWTGGAAFAALILVSAINTDKPALAVIACAGFFGSIAMWMI